MAIPTTSVVTPLSYKTKGPCVLQVSPKRSFQLVGGEKIQVYEPDDQHKEHHLVKIGANWYSMLNENWREFQSANLDLI
jgi:hypothetical protein